MARLKGVGGESDLRSVQQLLPRALPKRNMLSFWVFSVWWCIYLLHIQNLLTSLQSSFVQLVFIRKSNHLTVPSSPQDKKVYGSFGTVIICRQKQKDKNMRHQPPPHQVNCKQRLLFPSHCTLHITSYLISSAIVAGELALPVDFLALLCVCVENDAISWAGHYLLIISVGHELCAEDVGPVSWTNSRLDLQTKVQYVYFNLTEPKRKTNRPLICTGLV